ncbi:methylated-DNA--[protein]-cysteine S-methyltransferase [Leeuwenhoekiella sp. A16]|uniref:methylated-DNA--[protein]-cysteine S-methyltransferase n=1 Tax=unclassified Leeuwenhoekiella TaxID=2615029 RepID=UPI003A80A995
METANLNTELGTIEIKGDDSGLLSVIFLDDEYSQSLTVPACLQEAYSQLEEYFDGKRQDFRLKLTPQGTVFQQKVWKELENIPFGKTTSYLDMAKQLGDPKVIRAAASANGKNPISIIIPCHRVIGSNQSLTGYAGGLWRKKWLLAHESPAQQTTLF